jgi:hypothetical protein
MATTSQSNEMISTPQDSQELHDQKSRNNNSIQNSHVDLTTPQQNFSSGQQRISKNSGTISAGEHNGLIITKADTTYIGLGVPTINPTINFGIPTSFNIWKSSFYWMYFYAPRYWRSSSF